MVPVSGVHDYRVKLPGKCYGLKGAWWATVHGSQTVGKDLATEQQNLDFSGILTL